VLCRVLILLNFSLTPNSLLDCLLQLYLVFILLSLLTRLLDNSEEILYKKAFWCWLVFWLFFSNKLFSFWLTFVNFSVLYSTCLSYFSSSSIVVSSFSRVESLKSSACLLKVSKFLSYDWTKGICIYNTIITAIITAIFGSNNKNDTCFILVITLFILE
jgi:hypothetical protein